MTSLEQRGSRLYLPGKRSVTLKAFLKLVKFYSLSDIAMSVPNRSDEWL